jgi:hypothetical protein
VLPGQRKKKKEKNSMLLCCPVEQKKTALSRCGAELMLELKNEEKN